MRSTKVKKINKGFTFYYFFLDFFRLNLSTKNQNQIKKQKPSHPDFCFPDQSNSTTTATIQYIHPE